MVFQMDTEGWAMKRLMTALLVCGIACLSACATSAADYVQEMPGYSIIKGRFTRIENMHSEEMTPLSDGIVFVLSRAAWWIAGRWWFHWDPVIHGSSVLASSLAILAAALTPIALVHATLAARTEPALPVDHARDG